MTIVDEPVGESINIREGDVLPASQHGEPVPVELGLASRGQPELAGHQAGADKSCLF